MRDFLTALDITFWITPPPTKKLLFYTDVILQLTGKTFLEVLKKKKSLNLVAWRTKLRVIFFLQSIMKSDNLI